MYASILTLVFISTLFTATLALPQACFAGICLPPVRYGQPNYDDWARHEVEKWKEAERKRNKNKNKDKLHARAGLATTVIAVEDPEEEWAGVYICEDEAWGGSCTHTYSPLGSSPLDCTNIDGTASSIGPDPGYYCMFYTNAFCASLSSDGDDTLTLKYPGVENLGFTKLGDFNDRLLSYQCFKDGTEVDSKARPIGRPVNDGGME